MLCFLPSVCLTPHMVWFASKNGIAYWCEDPRPHAWSMCASCLCSCIFQSRATPPGRSRYQTSEFPSTSEFPTEIPTHNRTQAEYFSNGEGGMVDIDTGKRWGRRFNKDRKRLTRSWKAMVLEALCQVQIRFSRCRNHALESGLFIRSQLASRD
jgi:hypothetical protein